MASKRERHDIARQAVMAGGFALLLLDSGIDAGLAQDAGVPPPRLGPSEPPKGLDSRLLALRHQLDSVDNLALQGNTAAAKTDLATVEQELSAVREQYGGQIPMGHVPLLVLEERSKALRAQLGG
jgi:hypothetical protein